MQALVTLEWLLSFDPDGMYFSHIDLSSDSDQSGLDQSSDTDHSGLDEASDTDHSSSDQFASIYDALQFLPERLLGETEEELAKALWKLLHQLLIQQLPELCLDMKHIPGAILSCAEYSMSQSLEDF